MIGIEYLKQPKSQKEGRKLHELLQLSSKCIFTYLTNRTDKLVSNVDYVAC
jgi:hypothetical protein